MAMPHILVDFDRTLAKPVPDWEHNTGEPNPEVVAQVLRYLADGVEVRIFTARVDEEQGEEFVAQQRKLLEAWCEKYFLRKLPITNKKNRHTLLILDDIGRQVYNGHIARDLSLLEDDHR